MGKLFLKIFFVVMILVFLMSLTELFRLRFLRGDVYPAYSSLRADPLGTKVLYTSLGSFKDLTVSRNYQALSHLESHPHAALLYLGLGIFDLNVRERNFFQTLDQYAIDGGRLIISLQPHEVHQKESKDDKKNSEKTKEAKKAEEEKKIKDEEKDKDKDKDRYFTSITKRWGVTVDVEGQDSKDKGPRQAQKSKSAPESFPPSLTWHSQVVFKDLNSSWRVLYSVGDKPVMIEMLLGRGSIILMSDSYVFSNEALAKDRQTALLTTLFADRKQIVFDEHHLGVIHQNGVIDLMLKYRLHYLLLTLLIVLILIIWKNAAFSARMNDTVSLRGAIATKQSLPTGTQVSSASKRLLRFARNDTTLNIYENSVPMIESKRDSFEGLVSLLRKNIPTKDILRICVEQWRHSARGKKSDSEVKDFIDQTLVSVKGREGDEIKGYQRIFQRLKERKKYE